MQQPTWEAFLFKICVSGKTRARGEKCEQEERKAMAVFLYQGIMLHSYFNLREKGSKAVGRCTERAAKSAFILQKGASEKRQGPFAGCHNTHRATAVWPFKM